MTTSWSRIDDMKLISLYKELGSQWSTIAMQFPLRTPSQVASRWEKYLDPSLIKGAFTVEEDQLIIEFVNVHGTKSWKHVSDYVPGRCAKQCRERWYNHLDPSICNQDWTFEEDLLIFRKYRDFGSRWSKIAQFIPGRSDNAIKNRWNSSLKKRISLDSDGKEILLHSLSQRKRRTPKQKYSRPNPIQTQVFLIPDSFLATSQQQEIIPYNMYDNSTIPIDNQVEISDLNGSISPISFYINQMDEQDFSNFFGQKTP